MKLGQTSLVVFLSKVAGSALGFLATLYFARELGAEVIGVYALVLTVVSWLILLARLGIGGALTKRLSEGDQQGAYLSAALVWVLALAVAVSVAVVLAEPLLAAYIEEFDRYVARSVVWFVVAFIFVQLFFKTVLGTLRGEQKVHLAGLLDPVKIGSQSLVQLALVVFGYGLLGMLVGYIVGGVLVGLVGLVWVSTRLGRPARRHFRSLFGYAKFSWLGGFKSRVFNEVDILLLGVFVPTSLVGVYSVAWSISKFLTLFSNAVSSSVFPEISEVSAQENRQAAAGMIEDALTFSGLIAIPGLVGGVVLGERLLRLYGEAFVEGTAVLGLLILAVLFYSYQKQLLNALNGLDRPDLAFRVNAVFVALNAGLNLALIRQFGIEGAAVATALSAALAVALAYRALSGLVTFHIPYGELARQWAAAVAMGAAVWGLLGAIETTAIVEHNAVIVVGLVTLGAGLYFCVLLGISSRFREVVGRNLPVEAPGLG